MNIRGLFALTSTLFVAVASLHVEASSALWSDVDGKGIQPSGIREIAPLRARAMALDLAQMQNLLDGAPSEKTVTVLDSDFEIDLPTHEGDFARYRIVKTSVLAPELEARYPMLRTYLGQRVDQPSTTVRFDLTNRGFRAQVIAATHTSYVEPYQRGDTRHYSVFNKADYPLDREPMRCAVTGAEFKSKSNLLSKNSVAALASGANLRTYRLAVATTGEYTAALGGTKLDALSGIVTTMNRVNGIYERELAVRMQLVANNDLLIYTNGATDPYSNGNGSAMLGQNQLNLDTLIGSANYDIGHVFSTGGGGVAFLGSVCEAGSKAGGVTGQSLPRGDGFDVDFVAHEMGHQFAGDHTFNGETDNCGGGNREALSAYEVGSGNSIQAYAGICGITDLQIASDSYFHRRSLDQMLGFTTNPATGASCGVNTATGNTPPTVSTTASFTIPASTPFKLTANGSDANSDTLTYIWEQFDLGDPNTTDSLVGITNGPLFRNFIPTSDPTRVFPSLRYILNDANAVPNTAPIEGTTTPLFFAGERLPSNTRTMNFKVTVRDNRAGGGGTAQASTAVNVQGTAGPFVVTAPNTAAVSWTTGTSQTVTWIVANTTAAPIGTANVEIAVSVDGGFTFPHIVAASVANNGSHTFTVPTSIPSTTRARVRVAAVGNIFFDMSNANFTIVSSNTVPTLTVTGSVAVSQGGPSVTTAVATVSDAQQSAGSLVVSVSNVPPGLTVSANNNNGSVSLTATAACDVYAPTTGTRIYPISLTVTDSAGAGASTTLPVNVAVSGNAMPSIGSYANVVIAKGLTVTATPSAPIADANNNLVSRSVSPLAFPGSGAGVDVSIASNGTVTLETDANTVPGNYPIRVEATDSCGARRIREFSALVIEPGPYIQLASTQLPTGNGVIERNECNAFNVSVTNVGNFTATGVTATIWSGTPNLLATLPTVSLPDIAPGATQTTSVPMQLSTNNALACGIDANLTLVVSHNGNNSPRTFPLSFPTGVTSPVSNEAFDTVTAPNLPSGWTTARTGTTPPAFWATTTTSPDTAPNVAFTNGVPSIASNSLISPSITLPAAGSGATISIRHAWNFEGGFDGGVLELSTDGGTTFNDITSPTVGGVFTSNGYNVTIDTGFGNPIAGRAAWSAVQTSYVTSTVQLPAALNGQTIRLRFRAGWDSEIAQPNPNWRVDGVSVVSGRNCPNAGTGACSASPILNIDDSAAPSVYQAETDGLLLLRYLFGLRDAGLVANALGSSPQRGDATQIASYIATNLNRFDVDGDGAVRATTDGVLVLRRLLGLSGAALTSGVNAGTRSNSEIANAIDALRP
jgi:hypothetical protein